MSQLSEICFVTASIAVAAEATVSNTDAAGAVTGTLGSASPIVTGATGNFPIVPGSVSFSDGTNTITDGTNAVGYPPVYVVGTASGGSTTTVVDSTKNWATNAYAGYTVNINGQIVVIASNTATTLTVSTITAAANGQPYVITGPSFTGNANQSIGLLTGSPAGTGLINYSTGQYVITGAAASHSVAVNYSCWAGVTPARTFPNPLEPMWGQLKCDQTYAGGATTGPGVVVQVSDDYTNWKPFYANKMIGWQNANMGLVPMKYTRVFTTVTLRLTGSEANAV